MAENDEANDSFDNGNSHDMESLEFSRTDNEPPNANSDKPKIKKRVICQK